MKMKMKMRQEMIIMIIKEIDHEDEIDEDDEDYNEDELNREISPVLKSQFEKSEKMEEFDEIEAYQQEIKTEDGVDIKREP